MILLGRLREERGISLLVITQVTDRVAIMYAGRIVEKGSAFEILTTPRHPYSRALVGAFPVVGDPASRGVPAGLPGDPPDPASRPPGCAFHPRCRGDIPPLEELASNHPAACHVAAAGELPPATRKLTI